MKTLFILKRREDYSEKLHQHIRLSTGLYNSASFVVDMLNSNGIDAEIEVAQDNNSIDRLVTLHRPTHVVIEALWVVPTKFDILSKLHPKVTWIIRLHSELPFLAGEGMALDWIGDYISYPNVRIGVNAPRMMSEVQAYTKSLGREDAAIYMPNYYPCDFLSKEHHMKSKDTLDISCFGAVRPLKNHVVQAMGALKFVNKIGKKLNFHINGTRVEMKGDANLRNLRCMFMHLLPQGHQLIEHPWQPHEEFLDTCQTMDMGLQVSFTETFNIVSADQLSVGVPIVGSTEIPFLSKIFCADPTSSDDIARKMEWTYRFPQINVGLNQYLLSKYSQKTEQIWLNP